MQPYIYQEYKLLQNTKSIETRTLFEDSSDLWLKNYSPYSLKNKIQLFTYVVDLHIMSDINEVYETSWSLQWKKLFQEGLLSENSMQLISLGSTHTLVTSSKGRLYSWGWNDRGQCGHEFKRLQKEIDLNSTAQKSLIVQDVPFDKVQQVTCGEDHSLI